MNGKIIDISDMRSNKLKVIDVREYANKDLIYFSFILETTDPPYMRGRYTIGIPEDQVIKTHFSKIVKGDIVYMKETKTNSSKNMMDIRLLRSESGHKVSNMPD